MKTFYCSEGIQEMEAHRVRIEVSSSRFASVVRRPLRHEHSNNSATLVGRPTPMLSLAQRGLGISRGIKTREVSSDPLDRSGWNSWLLRPVAPAATIGYLDGDDEL